jgi:hypothetical protein
MKLITSNGTEYVLTRADTIVGRAPGCDIRLDDDKVSGKHAIFHMQGQSLALEDLNSTNGSFVNEVQVHGTQVVGVGDKLRLGDTMLAVKGDMDMGGTLLDARRPAASAAPVAAPTVDSPASSELSVFQGLAIAGMILGILSMPGGYFWYCGGPLGLIGVILSALGLRTPKGRWMAVVGLVTSVLGLIVALIFFLITVFFRSRSSGLPAGLLMFGW